MGRAPGRAPVRLERAPEHMGQMKRAQERAPEQMERAPERTPEQMERAPERVPEQMGRAPEQIGADGACTGAYMGRAPGQMEQMDPPPSAEPSGSLKANDHLINAPADQVIK